MRKTIAILVIVLLVLFMVGCENSVNPTQPQTQNDNEGISLAKKGGEQALNVPADWGTIQDAVDAIDGKGVIYVEAGLYQETVIIEGKEISLIADGNVIIAPLTQVGHGDAIQIYNSKVTIDGFEIDATNCKSGIYAGGGYPINDFAVNVKVINNNVHSYQKNGITVNGSKAYGNILNNKVWGSGPLGVPYSAQNGIQFGFGGTGKVRNNYIEGNLYTGPDWGATGLLIFESSDVIAQDNTIKGCGTGIAIQTWGWYLPNANNNKVDRNTVLDCEWGISVAAYDLGYPWDPNVNLYSQTNAFAVNNKIVNNVVKIVDVEVEGFVGIEFWAGTAWGGNSTTPTADNNKLIHNTISGYAEAISEYGTIKPKIHANVF